jgi:GR25 family glycosyltransferase involved in LPS biosynthesis
MITTKYSLGKRNFSKKAKEVFDAEYIYGIENNKYENGYPTELQDYKEGTKMAKMTKYNILKNFVQKSKNEYILILEDDVYVNKKMINNGNKILKQIIEFLYKNTPKVLYLGLNYTLENFNDYDEIEFENILPNGKFSGAYGFIVSKQMAHELITKIDNETPTKPFDIYVLSYLAKKYYDNCYYVNPYLVLPDISSSLIRQSFKQSIIWNKVNNNNEYYYGIKKGIIMIKTENEEYRKTFNFFTLKFLEPYYFILINKYYDFENVKQDDNINVYIGDESSYINLDNIENTIKNLDSKKKEIEYNIHKYDFE